MLVHNSGKLLCQKYSHLEELGAKKRRTNRFRFLTNSASIALTLIDLNSVDVRKRRENLDEAENIPDHLLQSVQIVKPLYDVCIHSLDCQCDMQCIQNPENVMP